MSAQHYTWVLTLMSLVFEQAILHTLYNDSVGKAQFSIECMDSRSCVKILGHCRVVLGVNQQFRVVEFPLMPPLLSPVIIQAKAKNICRIFTFILIVLCF